MIVSDQRRRWRRALRSGTRIKKTIDHAAGGPARARVVATFACALALESADLAAVGAAAPQLRSAFHISNTELGLLAAISTLVGALVTVPVGAMVDRVCRVNLLATAALLWGVAMLASAAAQDYTWLLASRLGLGAVTAAAGPAVASLTGDFFAPEQRAKVYGYILSGELLGAGLGFVVSGVAAGLLSWRWSFALLAAPAWILSVYIWRTLPEPRGASRRGGRARQRLPLRRAVVYVLMIRTNRWLIAASAIGYFFFSGLRTFAVAFVRGHFALSQATATLMLFLAGLGSLAGVLVSGRIADRLDRRGWPNARIVLPAACYLAAAAIFVPTLLLSMIVAAVPLLVLAGGVLAAANPPLDAARLDIVPAPLWGRAEVVRTLLRQSAQTAAPLLFGLLADTFSGTAGSVRPSGAVSPAAARGLQDAFLLMLIPLALNGLALLGARRSYPADASRASAST